MCWNRYFFDSLACLDRNYRKELFCIEFAVQIHSNRSVNAIKDTCN